MPGAVGGVPDASGEGFAAGVSAGANTGARTLGVGEGTSVVTGEGNPSGSGEGNAAAEHALISTAVIASPKNLRIITTTAYGKSTSVATVTVDRVATLW